MKVYTVVAAILSVLLLAGCRVGGGADGADDVSIGDGLKSTYEWGQIGGSLMRGTDQPELAQQTCIRLSTDPLLGDRLLHVGFGDGTVTEWDREQVAQGCFDAAGVPDPEAE